MRWLVVTILALGGCAAIMAKIGYVPDQSTHTEPKLTGTGNVSIVLYGGYGASVSFLGVLWAVSRRNRRHRKSLDEMILAVEDRGDRDTKLRMRDNRSAVVRRGVAARVDALGLRHGGAETKR